MTKGTNTLKDSIEQTYCFFHQKWRVYEHSNMEWQKEDIEYAISEYIEQMNPTLYHLLAGDNPQFLKEHIQFKYEMPQCIERLEEMLTKKQVRHAHIHRRDELV